MEDALLLLLFTQATEEYYETMKTSLVQISLKTPKVRGLENEDISLRRLLPAFKGGGFLFYALAAGGLRSCHFCHRLITKLSLLSFPSLTEVTVLSLLYMFFGLKSVPWQYFSCHFKSAKWILFITSVQLEHMTIFIAKQRTSCPLDYKWPFKPIFLQRDASVTSVISASIQE